VAQLLYASPAWNGFIKSEEKAKLQSVLNKTARYGFLPEWSRSPKTIDELLESSDITLFKAALKNPDHVIHPVTHSSHLLKHPVTTLKNAVMVSSYPPPNLTSFARILYIVCYLKTFISYYMFYSLHMLLNHCVMTVFSLKKRMNE